jgi:hypothetical protein
MQLAIVILVVVACAMFLAYQAFRYFKPKAGSNKLCAGGCCDGAAAQPAASSPGASRTIMISSDDLRNRIKARK